MNSESFARIARRIAACMSLQTINLSGNRFGDGGVSLFCRYAFEHRHFAHLELGASDLFEVCF
jgi:Ran GTPase-activating protein (RanGAP) involved in mRNA processing and transport